MRIVGSQLAIHHPFIMSIDQRAFEKVQPSIRSRMLNPRRSADFDGMALSHDTLREKPTLSSHERAFREWIIDKRLPFNNEVVREKTIT